MKNSTKKEKERDKAYDYAEAYDFLMWQPLLVL